MQWQQDGYHSPEYKEILDFTNIESVFHNKIWGFFFCIVVVNNRYPF